MNLENLITKNNSKLPSQNTRSSKTIACMATEIANHFDGYCIDIVCNCNNHAHPIFKYSNIQIIKSHRN